MSNFIDIVRGDDFDFCKCTDDESFYFISYDVAYCEIKNKLEKNVAIKISLEILKNYHPEMFSNESI